jgi:hypothetical protein
MQLRCLREPPKILQLALDSDLDADGCSSQRCHLGPAWSCSRLQPFLFRRGDFEPFDGLSKENGFVGSPGIDDL